MKFMRIIETATKQFYFKKQTASIGEMSARLFWIPNSLVIWMGCNIFSEEFTTKSLKFVQTMICMSVFAVSQVNSFFHDRNDLEKFLFKLITSSILLQTSGKLHAFILRRPDLMKSVELCKKFLTYLENDEMRICFEKWIMIGFYGETVLGFLFLAVLLLVLTYPAIVYAVFNSVTLIVPVVIPSTDEKSAFGYILNYFFQVILVSMTFMGFLAAIMDVVIFVVHLLAFFESLEIMLDLLQKLTRMKQTVETVDEKQRILKKLAEGHNWCYEYLDNFENCFQIYHLCDIASSIFGTVLCLYGVTKVFIIIY